MIKQQMLQLITELRPRVKSTQNGENEERAERRQAQTATSSNGYLIVTS